MKEKIKKKYSILWKWKDFGQRLFANKIYLNLTITWCNQYMMRKLFARILHVIDMAASFVQIFEIISARLLLRIMTFQSIHTLQIHFFFVFSSLHVASRVSRTMSAALFARNTHTHFTLSMLKHENNKDKWVLLSFSVHERRQQQKKKKTTGAFSHQLENGFNSQGQFKYLNEIASH